MPTAASPPPRKKPFRCRSVTRRRRRRALSRPITSRAREGRRTAFKTETWPLDTAVYRRWSLENKKSRKLKSPFGRRARTVVTRRGSTNETGTKRESNATRATRVLWGFVGIPRTSVRFAHLPMRNKRQSGSFAIYRYCSRNETVQSLCSNALKTKELFYDRRGFFLTKVDKRQFYIILCWVVRVINTMWRIYGGG